MLKYINIYKLFSFTLLLTVTLIGCGGGGVSGDSSSGVPDPYTFNVAENQISAFKASVIHTKVLTYSLALEVTDNDDFNINATTGVVTFKGFPDYETKKQYKVTVNASDGLAFNSNIVYTINITDVNDPYTFNATENQTSAITASISHPKVLTYSLAAGITDNDSFNINATTAVVTFKIAPDFETKNQYKITVNASDGSTFNTNIVYTINITNVDDTAPVFSGSFSSNVAENQISAFIAVARDSNPITYSLEAGITDNNDFNIDSSVGVVTFKTAADYETKTSYSITVTASDSLSNVSTQVYTLGIINLDDDAPVFTGSFTATVAENQTSAITASTRDLNTVTYSLAPGVNDNDDFTINSSTGVVVFQSAPNYEATPTKTTYIITVGARDSLSYTSIQDYTINISDIDENGPVFNTPYIINADENQTSVSAISVSDINIITYSLASGITDNDDFNINSSTGVLSFKVAPDYETKTSYTITITARDNLNNFASQVYTVNINNVDDSAPIFTGSFSSSVVENQKAAFTAVASDVNVITYSLDSALGDNDTFSIDVSSGAVRFKLYPNFEAIPSKTSFSITVRATDTQSNSATQVYTLGLSDVNENITFNSLAYKFIISQITGRFWLDRNIGASRVCISSNDVSCYGNYYQFGRLRDGHELSTSANITTRATNIVNAGSNFIINTSSPMDWLSNSTQDSNDIDDNGSIRNIQWSQTNGNPATNNIVCPSGYRVPTIAEIKAETLDDSIADIDINNNGTIEVINSASAFENFLKLPTSGYRNNSGLPIRDSSGYLWSVSVSGGNASSINYNGTNASENTSTNLVSAYPIRCIKHETTNISPTIDAGANQNVYIGNTVTLTASAGFASYEWKEGSTTFGSSQSLIKSDFTLGIHYLTVIGTHSNGEKAVDTVSIRVNSTSISHNSINYEIITSPYTSKKWLDRNIGASQVCISSTDASCYGDYFQWGRLADGHEKQISTTTATTIAYDDNSSNEYITQAEWGRGDTSGALRVARWNQITGNINGVSGATYTDVCPVGFRVPTQAEVIAETTSEGVINNATAFTNFLKLPVAGNRKADGVMQNVGNIVYLWYNTPNGITEAKYLRISSGSANDNSSLTRGFAGSIRCIGN